MKRRVPTTDLANYCLVFPYISRNHRTASLEALKAGRKMLTRHLTFGKPGEYSIHDLVARINLIDSELQRREQYPTKNHHPFRLLPLHQIAEAEPLMSTGPSGAICGYGDHILQMDWV